VLKNTVACSTWQKKKTQIRQELFYIVMKIFDQKKKELPEAVSVGLFEIIHICG
jgi:hypothetical protein